MENKKINSNNRDSIGSIPTIPSLEQENELHYAILDGNIDLAKSLLEKPETDVNTFVKGSAEDFEFEEYYTTEITPLFIAIKERNLEMVKLLVSHPNIDVNLRSKHLPHSSYEMTPLIFALAPIISCNEPANGEDKDSLIEIAKVLLSHPNIDVNVCFLNGATPFQTAVRENCPEIVDLLIDRPEININKPIKYLGNKTPLEYAIGLFNGFDLINVLLKNKNLDLSAEGTNGKSMFDLAFEKIPFDFSNEKKTVKMAKLIFAKRIFDINEKTEDIKEKQKKMLEQKKILEKKKEEVFSKYSYELSTIDELMEEYFPENKPECNIF